MRQAIDWILNPPNEKFQGRCYWERALRGPLRFLAIAHERGVLSQMPGVGAWTSV